MFNNNLVEIAGEILSETRLAIYFYDGYIEIWIPKSQINNMEDIEDVKMGSIVEIKIPEWLAKNKELI